MGGVMAEAKAVGSSRRKRHPASGQRRRSGDDHVDEDEVNEDEVDEEEAQRTVIEGTWGGRVRRCLPTPFRTVLSSATGLMSYKTRRRRRRR
uniref:Uncharacterized protein n=1 Tax=Plectus sambesii TaxID=2011161 RepID=A0A914WMI1_9BILA